MQSTKTSIQLDVNGKKITAEFYPQTPLLYVLRNQLALNGPKYGCGLGQCGSCMVLIDGQAGLSCVIPADGLADKKITTLAGVGDKNGDLHPVQQVAGEELNTEPAEIQVIIADTGLTPNEGTTAGSRSMERSAIQVRRAAAAVREQLKKLAADRWQISDEDVAVEQGQVINTTDNAALSFNELLEGQQLSSTIPEDVPLKPKSDYRWVSQPVPHSDVEKIVRGEPVYVQDMRLPGMVHARVVRPQVYGARVSNWSDELMEMPEVLKVVKDGSFIAVIAEEEYQAVKAMETLQNKLEWKVNKPLPELPSWSDFLVKRGRGPAEAGNNGPNAHSAVYSKPYVMHGSIGPSCAVAFYENEQLHL